jgi:hypothetical protein
VLPQEITQMSLADGSSHEWLAADWFAINRIDERLAALVSDNNVGAPLAEAFRQAVPTVVRLRAEAAAGLRTPAQIAAFGREAGWTESGLTMWLGKKLMTGSDWWGVNQLPAGR